MEVSIPFNRDTWRRMLKLVGKKSATTKATMIRAILDATDQHADYHYHFLAVKYAMEGKRMIDIEISLHTNRAAVRRKYRGGPLAIADVESWLLDFLGRKFERRSLDINFDCRFSFKKPSFAPVLPMPFKSPFEIPNKKSALEGLSISGLKFQVENSAVGLNTLYFETFQKSIGIRTVFGQQTTLKVGVFEHALMNAAKIALLFVKSVKEEQTDANN